MKNLPKAVVIIPSYNEKDNLPRLIPVLEQVFLKITNWQMAILVVDDTSPDGTYLLVQKLQKKYKNLHLILNKTKAGLGKAYLNGMDYAFDQLQADVVFEFDADFSHDPSKIPQLLAKIDQGFDLVLGSRYIKGGSIPSNWGWHRKLLSVGGNLFINFVMANFRYRDWTSGFRAIRKKVYQAVRQEMMVARFTGYTFQMGFLHKALRGGFKICEVPIQFKDRTYGKSKIGPEYIKNNLLFILKVRSDEILANRLVKFALVGGVGACVQFLSLALLRQLITYTLAYFLAAEMAVLSNFIFSNLWTFNDRKLTLLQIPAKFVMFNLASFGSVGIQTLLAEFGRRFIGEKVSLFVIPFSSLLFGRQFIFDTGFLFMLVGIFLGMIWNFTAYTRVIWKKR